MDDLRYGTRDKRGNWEPLERVHNAPIFAPPFNPTAIMKWLFGYPGYILPWNLFYALIAVAVWFWATPPLDAMTSFEPEWIALILARNLALVVAFYGFLHMRLYVSRAQGNLFKFNHRWLDTDNPAFLFRNQTIDNMIWSLASAVPIWTAYEVVTLWGYANGFLPYLDAAAHPYAFAAMMLVLPLFREVHFYCIHRLIHWPPIYRTVHKLHHANVNPGPWSGLAMHPVEHLLYFSGVLVHWIVPSHPIHAIFHLQHAGLSPAQGHTGFHKMVVGEEGAVDLHCYAHYLHHKYFEVNYADGAVPLDKWFGTFHDGSPEAEEQMNRRMKARTAKQAVKQSANHAG